MAILVGSARHDENGKYVNGAVGDQLQTSSKADTAGEVSMQEMYKHNKGWYILRPKSIAHAKAIAERMKAACNNPRIGYDQNNRLGVVTYGIDTQEPTECDCSSLVRECIKEATGKDPGNFTTGNQASKLAATGLFEDKVEYVSQAKTPVYDGDVLVTKTKGHTVIVVEGNPRSEAAAAQPVTKTVKAAVSAKSFSKGLAGAYKVNSSDGTMNVRKKPGVMTDSMIMVNIPNGTKVQCYGYYTNVSGTKWLYVQFTYEGVTYTGFCHSNLLRKL